MVTYTERTLGSWVVPMPVLIERLQTAAAAAIADPTNPTYVDDFDTLAYIAEQRAAGGTFGNPIRTIPQRRN